MKMLVHQALLRPPDLMLFRKQISLDGVSLYYPSFLINENDMATPS